MFVYLCEGGGCCYSSFFLTFPLSCTVAHKWVKANLNEEDDEVMVISMHAYETRMIHL